MTVREIKTGTTGTVKMGKSVHYVTWLETKGSRKEGWVHQVGAHKFAAQFEVIK